MRNPPWSFGDVSSFARIRGFETAFKAKTDAVILSGKFSINDLQRIVALEYGYTSWATLNHFIESLDSPAYQGVADKRGYHQTIVESYDKRSKVYDKSEWHRDLATQTVDYCPPETGNTVLDIATGTGTFAFYTANLVGIQGSVTGIDISKDMLENAMKNSRSRG